MSESSAASPQKPHQIQPGGGGGDPIAPSNNQNPSIASSTPISPSPSMEHPVISSPQLPLLSQNLQPQMNSAAGSDYPPKQQMQPQLQTQSALTPQQQQQKSQHLQVQQQQQQQQQPPPQQLQQQSVMGASTNFQIQQQNLQRTASSIPRIAQIQQQFGAAAAANVMRQHTGIYGQMNFGGSHIHHSSSRSCYNNNNSSSSSSSNNNNNTAAAAAPRQKAGLVQASQFHPSNSTGQTFQGVQSIGMMSSLGQLRANGPLSLAQQRLHHGQMRQQQLLQQTPPSPQKLTGQGLQRTSSLASMTTLSGLAQNGQSALMQNSLSQPQQWMRQMQPAMSSPGSPSYHIQPQQQRHQQAFLQQQFSSQMQQKVMAMSQQQISQLVQQQQQSQLGTQQQHQSLQPTLTQQQQQQLQLLQQQQSPRMPGSAVQKSTSLTGSYPENPVSSITTPGGGANQGADASNQLLGKRKIQDLVSQVDPLAKLDPEVEDLLLEIADDFIDSVTSFACSLAKHRKSSTLESKDLLLHLEKNWKLKIPGFTNEDHKYQRKLPASSTAMAAPLPPPPPRTHSRRPAQGQGEEEPGWGRALRRCCRPSSGASGWGRRRPPRSSPEGPTTERGRSLPGTRTLPSASPLQGSETKERPPQNPQDIEEK
ncbi:unnamed protein product [Spirodela intermedia]|uniref:Transcription initiation factor TFIID subunit 12 domain-containing protein n=1 Tax=Spirodela intermedia TaxID=51605 RepID=A0A7I8IVB6_SPIIN|nr:unnamed protein product [Spirodela intermedia]CAA6661719.1 unnamed protein product [Spirodela intermedia]